ncbi:MAG: DNA mismatch repair protein MutS [Polyangiaceae bacterium]|nr:DNA mismatch repair protein MutS [Polyangiaceae bacterium]
MAGPNTPVMQQHAEAKNAYPDALIFFRLGDFYEMFGDDAVLGARLLDLTLTSRNKGKPDEIPMAGVPYHAAHNYIGRLLAKGCKVAICEQMADPSTVKGIVPRQVVRVITPGTVTSEEHLSPNTNNWLCAVEVAPSGIGLALLDLSTGELRATELADVALLLAEIAHASPSEIVIGGVPEQVQEARTSVQATLSSGVVREDSELSAEAQSEHLSEFVDEARALSEHTQRAVARALRFIRECHPGRAELPVRRLVHWDPAQCLHLDARTQIHLELVRSLSGNEEATLLHVIDQTSTALGARLLRRQILAPLVDHERIRRRLDGVEFFVQNPGLRSALRECLSEVADFERLGVRASLGEATPRDLGKLRDGLLASERAANMLNETRDLIARESLRLSEKIDTITDLAELLAAALVERPPTQAKEGSVFRPGYDAELDEFADLKKSGAERMIELEARLRDETDIGTLKVRFTRVFGWYIEVSRSHTAKAPKAWRRKQTVSGGERFTTEELDELAHRITSAEDRHRERELLLFSALVAEVASRGPRLYQLASMVARWDVAASLAEVAHRYDYCRPHVEKSDGIEIRDGRHPVVERLAAEGRFVPNDVELNLKAERLWLITGPNMAGKSTFLRQVALTVILAQMGSFVPARFARIGLVDRVLSRVGASDNLAQGQSTFMVEMTETAEILRRASQRSLVILDEIGRGTSTFDGLAIAWAVAEYLDEAAKCRALFATHYHELTTLAEDSRHMANYSVSAREQGEDIVFLHRVVAGAASRSYGIAVAKLAGLPESVLARARALLTSFEAGSTTGRRNNTGSRAQLGLFESSHVSRQQLETLETLRSANVENMTPLDALQFLARLKEKI